MGKVKVRTCILIMLAVIICFECEFNYMLSLGVLSNITYSKIIKCVMCVLTYVFYLQCVPKIKVSKELRHIQLLFIAIIPISFFVTAASGCSILDSFLLISHYFYIFLIEPILYVMMDEKYRKRLLGFLLICACVTLLARAYMSFYYHDNNHKLLFPMLSAAAGTKVRYSEFFGYSMLRVFPSCFGQIVLFSFAYISILAKKIWQKLLAISMAILTLMYYIFLYQARGYTVIFAVELLILFLACRYKEHFGLKTLLKYIIAISIVIILLNSPFVQNLLNSFSVDSELGESTSIRLDGIGLVFSKFFETIPFGIGGNGGFDSVNGMIYLDDYGCMEFIVKNNILGVAVYVILVLYMFKNLIKFKNSSSRMLMLTCVLVLLTGMLVVDNFSARKIGAVPFVIALFEWSIIRERKIHD